MPAPTHLPPSPRRAEVYRRAAVAEVMAETYALDLATLTETYGTGTRESMTRLELAIEDIGWTRLLANSDLEFSRAGLERIAAVCKIMWRKNPLIRRGVNIRTYYTWGQGVSVKARDDDVNQVVQDMLNDEVNIAAMFGQDARETLDRELATSGNVPIIAATSIATGAIQVRTVPWTTIIDRHVNPQDAADVQFWIRRWYQDGQIVKVAHPDLSNIQTGIRPPQVDGIPVRWDQPLMMVTADRLVGDTWGTPEVYAALDWARAYKEFLEDWAGYVKALAEFAWRHKTKTSPAARRARATHETPRTNPATGVRRSSGATAVGTDVDMLEPIKQSGAHVDATSGRPLAVMVAAAFELPYSMLTGDADHSNLATAQALDRPTELAFMSRQRRWAEVYRRLCNYAVAASVAAPAGVLSGRLERDVWGHVVPVMPEGVDPSVDVDFPPLVEHDMAEVVKAITDADSKTDVMPPDVVLRLLLTTFGIDDADQYVEDMMAAAATQATVDQAADVIDEAMADLLREHLAAA